MVSLANLVRKAVESALKEGADQAEVFAQKVRRIDVEIEKNATKLCTTAYDYGVAVRAFKRGGMGFAYTQRLLEESAIKVGRKAAKLAQGVHPDPDFVTLPEPEKAPTVPGLYNKELAEINIEEVIEIAGRMIDAAKAVPDAILMGGVTVISEDHALVNSLGIFVEDASTAIGMGAMGIVRRGGDVGSFNDWDQGRSLKDVKPEEVSEKAVKSAEKYLKAKKVETGTFPVVFGFMPSFSLIASTLAGAANAESIQRDRSFLVGKLGQNVASELMTVIDDGTVPGGIISSTYDSEGVPKRRLVLLDKGILKTYLHNSYTANKAKVESTASAMRMGYASSVGIGPSNLQIKPGEWKIEEMIEDMKEGIYFETGSVYGDAVTGDVSKPVDFGFKVEKGEIAYPVKATLIGTNLTDLLRGIDAVSEEYREEPGLIMPALRAQKIRVAGAK